MDERPGRARPERLGEVRLVDRLEPQVRSQRGDDPAEDVGGDPSFEEWVRGRDEKWDPALDEDPDESCQLGVEHAPPDQLDDGRRLAGDRWLREGSRELWEFHRMRLAEYLARSDRGVAFGSMPIEVVPATAAVWPALEAMFREGGDPRWCWCQYWRLRSKDFGSLKVPELRERLRGQVDGAIPPGLVALEGAGPANPGRRAVGWVAVGPRTGYERIVRSRVIPTVDARPAWSITCFAVSKDARGTGVATALLGAAVDFAIGHGADVIEAYPVAAPDGEPIGAEGAFTGVLPMFTRFGFEVVAERASDPSARHPRSIVRLEVGPRFNDRPSPK